MVSVISVEEALQVENRILIDARSPAEFENDHIFGAINIPLLDDAERHEIGLIYKNVSREEAIEKGLGFFSTRIPSLYSRLRGHEGKNIVVYCARGGMRSGIIASLLESVGFNVSKIKDGYKGFRNYIVKRIDDYELKPKVVVLYGLSCTGKTAILEKMNNSLDLEYLAQHHGSLMGALGMNPSSQKKFENELLRRLDELQNENVIFVEGESRRIGDVIIPPFLWKAMCNGKRVLITRSIEKRSEMMACDYFKDEFLDELKGIIMSFKRVISTENKEKVVALINSGEHVEGAKIVLEKYYDPLYAHTLNDMKYVAEISSDDEEKAVEEIKKIAF